MFIDVMELTYTDDGNGVCEKPTCINTNYIRRIESIENGDNDYDANIIMNDGTEILVSDYRYDSLIDLILGNIESYSTCSEKSEVNNLRNKTNQKVRNAIREKGLMQYEVAKLFGVREEVFSRQLRYELPEEKQNELIEKINGLKAST